MNGVAGIDKEVTALKNKITKTMAVNDARKVSRKNLARDANTMNISVMKLKSTIDKNVDAVNNGNASIKAITNSILSLEQGKKNPQAEIAKANKASAAAFKGVLGKLAELDKQAVDRRATILQVQKDWRFMKGNGAVFRKELTSIAPN